MLRWTLHLKGEPHRTFYAAVAVGNEVYAFRPDVDDKDWTEVSVFNTESLRWVKLTPETPGRGERPIEGPPFQAWGLTAVLIEYTVYIWGGKTQSLHAFDVDAHRWSNADVSGTVPEVMYRHSACVLGKVMYIHGGYNYLTGNNTYKLDTTTMVWTLINPRGTPHIASFNHSANIIGTKMFVFGGGWMSRREGRVDVGYYKTIRVFDTETNQWLPDTPTPQIAGRVDHSAFNYNGELYIFGGLNPKPLNDLWKFSPETFSWKKLEPKGKGPSPKYRMCCCMMGDSVILLEPDLSVLDFSPSLKALCKLSVIQYDLEQSELPHNIRCELAAMTAADKK